MMQNGQNEPGGNLPLTSAHEDDILPLPAKPTRARSALASPFSRRAMLRATAWGALGASAALSPAGLRVAAADPRSSFGPRDGKLLQGNDPTRLTSLRVPLDVADYLLSATFRNPNGSDGSPSPFWSYGFGVRHTPIGGAYIYVRSDYRWGVFFFSNDAQGKRTYDDARYRTGTVSDLQVGADGTNDLQVIVSGATAELIINGMEVAAIDLGDLLTPGEVAIATGIDKDSTAPGTVVEYRQFQVSPAPPATLFALRAPAYLYGPANGGIRHMLNPNAVDAYSAGGLRVQDGTVSARFFNPYGAGNDAFDYGFELRDTDTSLYRLILLSDRTYSLRYRVRQSVNVRYGPSQVIQEGDIDSLNIGLGEANDIDVQLNGANGTLLIGGDEVASLDLSDGVEAGGVKIGTGFFNGNEQMGSVTRYENFTIALPT